MEKENTMQKQIITAGAIIVGGVVIIYLLKIVALKL
jgi:hypothetical protein